MAHIQTNRWQLSRRQLLRGAGATLALPFLEAMRPLYGQTASSGDPVRMACLFMPNGVRTDKWTPSGSGKSFKLSPILSPLEALKEHLTVISGLTNQPSHKGDQKQLDQYQRINTWHSAQLAYLLKAMKSLPEGNVLDNSMVLFGSGIRDGNAHATKDIPVVIAGGANGQLKTGRHLKANDNAPLASLYVGMMKRMGVPTKSIGNASNELRGL